MAKRKTTRTVTKKPKAKPARRKALRSDKDIFPMKLTGKLFLEYKAAMNALWAARSDLKHRELQLKTLLEKPEHQIVVKHHHLVQDALKEVSTTQTQFKEIQARIAEKFGITQRDLIEYTINEYSGAMVFTPPKEDDHRAGGTT